jgi:TetR/AcrR family transcriptional repressor of lmrAB and yxaGH operons
MARPALIEDAELLQRISAVFKDAGYEAASLTQLSKASGLKRASLYHRFPGGKEQMAREVLEGADTWLKSHVLDPLTSDIPPRQRVQAVADAFDGFYEGGAQSCLLNMLSSTGVREAPFALPIRRSFECMIDALARASEDSGMPTDRARARAERVVVMLQGSLVVSRGLGTTRPFRDFLRALPNQLLAPELPES